MESEAEPYPEVEKRVTAARREVWRIYSRQHGWRWMAKEAAIKLLRKGFWTGKED